MDLFLETKLVLKNEVNSAVTVPTERATKHKTNDNLVRLEKLKEMHTVVDTIRLTKKNLNLTNWEPTFAVGMNVSLSFREPTKKLLSTKLDI